MKKKTWLAIIFLSLALIITFKPLINKSDNPTSKTNYLMGTIVNLNIYDKVEPSLFENTFDVIRDIENKMSLNLENSEINKINKQAKSKTMPLSSQTRYVLEKSLYFSQISKGNFDVTIGSLVKLWGIGSENARLPLPLEIKDSLSTIGYKNMILNDEGVRLNKDGMLIDLGAIAKGYAADQAIAYLKTQNIKRAIVDIGGNIYVLGDKAPDTPWTVGIQNPFTENRGDFLGSIKVSNKSVVTSGVYERYLEVAGKKYHHILNPFTGYPVENDLMSVSIISDKSIDGDALSTATFSLGLKEGYELVRSLEDVEAIFVSKDKTIYLSPGLKDNFHLENTDFKIKEL